MNYCRKWIKIIGFSIIVTLYLFNYSIINASSDAPEDVEWAKHSKSIKYYIVDNVQYTYDINGDYARIVRGKLVDRTKKTEIIHIPEEIYGYTVVAIGLEGSRETEAYPFAGLDDVKEIVVPDTVVKLYYGSFCDLPALEKVILPDHITVIPDSTFSGCENLKEIELPEQLEVIGEFAFSYTGLKNISIPEGVSSIGRGAFLNCKLLKTVQLSDKINTIEKVTFAHCVKLKDINLEHITYFGDSSFQGCTKLKNITFNKCISYIGYYTLNDTKWFNEQQSNAFVIINKKFLIQYNGDDKKPTIPKGVTHIIESAFYNKKLSSIEIPDTVTFIGAYAFSQTGIKSIYFAGNAPEIEVRGDESIVNLDSKVKIYYKKGKTGYGTKEWKVFNPKTYTKYQ